MSAAAYLRGLGLAAPPGTPRRSASPPPPPTPVHEPSGPWVGVPADELVWWRREGRISLMARELHRSEEGVTLWIGMEDRTVLVPANEVESHADMRRRRERREEETRLAQARASTTWRMREPLSPEERERRRERAQAEARRRDEERDRRLTALESEVAALRSELRRR